MTDHFAAMQKPRRPWLDPDELKESFHRASTTLHPDVPATGDAERFSSLNAAYAVLREPASRTRHLLELVAPGTLASTGAPPMELADLFMQLAGLRRRAGEFEVRRSAASAPLARALLAGEESTLRSELEAAVAQIETVHDEALAALRELDASWKEDDAHGIAVLGTLHQRLAYLGRWLAQTREALFTHTA